MTIKNLESKVVNEIDSWDLNINVNNKPVKYSDKLNSLLYGPGIDAVRKICDSYNNPNLDFTKLPYDKAKKEFIKQYLINNLEKNNLNSRETAESMGISWTNFRQYCKAYGIKIKELKKSKEQTNKTSQFNPVNIAEGTLGQYEGLFNPQMLNTFLKRKKKVLADRLSKVASDIIGEEYSINGLYADRYFELPFQWAPEKFKKDYIKHMVKKHKHGRDVAKAMGMTYGSLRFLLSKKGIKLKED